MANQTWLTLWWIFKYALLSMASFLVLYLAASILLSCIPTGGRASDKAKPHRIYLFSNGVHLDFVFPLALIPEDVLSQLDRSEGTQYLGIGWGDKGFYLDTPTWAELKASTAISAMFLPSPTAMHVTEHRALARNWSYTDLTDAQLTQLWSYIRQSFKTDASGRFDELEGEGYTQLDRFYEANGQYSCFVTCNTWVNSGLKKIGVRTAVWTPIDKGVLRYLPKVGR